MHRNTSKQPEILVKSQTAEIAHGQYGQELRSSLTQTIRRQVQYAEEIAILDANLFVNLLLAVKTKPNCEVKSNILFLSKSVLT